AESRALRPLSGYANDCRGVDSLADGVAADRARRLGLRHEVEYGLDARHARVFLDRSRLPQVPPSRDHVQPLVRVHRELRAAALARRGRVRQALAACEDAGRRLAALRESADAVRL